MMKGVTILSAYINDQKELKCGIDPNGNPVFCGIRFENDFQAQETVIYLRCVKARLRLN